MEKFLKLKKREVIVSAPATVANVVCGFDVLGFALNEPSDLVKISLSDRSYIKIIDIKGADLSYKLEENVVGVVLQAFFEVSGISPIGLDVSIFKGIPPGSGIGSSAASAASAAFAINSLFGNILSNEQLISIAMVGERLASGTAHADNVAPSILGGFTLVRTHSPLDIIRIPFPDELFVSVIHPQIELKTSDSRALLKAKVSLKSATQQWANVGALVAGLFSSDYELIGRSLHDEIIEPERSFLIVGFQEAKKAAMEAGALGGGISGSGPSIFMLSKGLDIAKKVAKEMSLQYEQLAIEHASYVNMISPYGAKLISSIDI